MSIQVYKNYSITINAATVPIVWYGFETNDASGVIDSANGYNIPRANITSAAFPQWTAWTVVPGLVNNCFNTTQTGGVQGSINPSPFDLSGNKSITVRFWFNSTFLDNGVFLYYEVNTPCFGCRFIGGAANANIKARCYLQMATTPLQFGDITIACTPNAWHRMVFQFDQPNGLLGIQLDNNAMQTQAITVPAPPFANTNKVGQYFYIIQAAPQGGGNSNLDELTIWNSKLSSSQLLYDWNGGSGRSYPNTPP